MKNNLIEIINNTIVLKENDDFYQEYENTKWEGCQIKLKSMLDVIKTTPYYQLLLDMYKHIDEQRLYKSETHGINHNERVMLYSTFIAIKENLKEESPEELIQLQELADMLADVLIKAKGQILAKQEAKRKQTKQQ